MPDQLDVLLTVVSRLDKAGTPYMLSGSTAMGLYARPRMTRDIDLVVELTRVSAADFCALFSADFYVDEETVAAAVRRQGMFNLIHLDTLVKVDCIVRKDSEYRRLEFSRRRAIFLAGRPIWVVAPEDLVLSKLAWARDSRSELQLEDVRSLLRDVPGLDEAYLRRWAEALGVGDLLEGALP